MTEYKGKLSGELVSDSGDKLSIIIPQITIKTKDSEPGPDPDPPNGEDNEPPGLEILHHVKGDRLDWGSGFPRDSDRVSIVDDPDAKYGKAIEKRSKIGDESGWLKAFTQLNFRSVRRIYFRIEFKLSENYQFHKSGVEKLFLYGRKIGHSSTSQFVINYGGGTFRFVNQGAPHWGDKRSRGTFNSNDLKGVDKNKYYKVEIYHILNTPGQSDGSVNIWVNNKKLDNWNHMGAEDNVKLENMRFINWDQVEGEENKFDGSQFFLFWGGQDGKKTVSDYMRLGEVYVSGK